MHKFFNPKSVAIVGVSSAKTNLAKRILVNLRRFRYTGKVYAVGPREEDVEGYSVYRSVLDIEADVDLAILLVPAANTPAVAEQCGLKGIKHLIIESGGFGELEGEESGAEHELLAVCRKHGIRFIGPNCIGVVNQENGFCSPFSRQLSPFIEGGVSVISQSGGVGASHVMDLTSEFIGINKFISYGNGLDIDEVDLINYLGADSNATVISAYIEGIYRGRELLRSVSRQKLPIVVLKSNTQPLAHAVATSHSAALKGDEDVLNAAFRQVGILRVPNALVWTNVAKQLTMPLMKGNRLAILSRSGGHAVLAADGASHYGFEMPSFPPEFFKACRQYFEQSVVNLRNPLDLGQIFFHPVMTHILEETLKLDEFDGILLIYNFDAMAASDEAHQFISQILPLMYRYNKPVTTVLFTQRDERQYIRENYELPLFRTPFHGMQALAYSRDAVRAAQRRRPFEVRDLEGNGTKAREILNNPISEERNPSLCESFELLKSYGVLLADYVTADSRDDALEVVEQVGFPLALKIDDHAAPRKSDIGGVQLNLKDDYGLITGWDEIDRCAKEAGLSGGIRRAAIQKMAAQGWEMFVGGKRDISFGPIVCAGSGGLLADVVQDVAVRVAPISEEDADELLIETKANVLLQGFRDHPPADRQAVVELLMKVSRIMLEVDEIEQIDLNPVIVHPEGKGLTVVDARIVLADRKQK